MAKKVPISVTIDGDVLRSVDNVLRGVQEKELKSRRSLSTRSSLVERYLREGVDREAKLCPVEVEWCGLLRRNRRKPSSPQA